jgi:uncharacterized protein YqgC (DUF456 family)
VGGVSGIEELIIGIAILAGLVGVVVPIIPGAFLVLGAIGVWAFQLNSPAGWVTLGIALIAIGVSQVIKYLIPARQMRDAGVPNRTVLVGGVLGVAGFFVIPVVGLFAGFLLGVYVAELLRVGRNQAWPSTLFALRAVGVSIMIELAGCLIAATAWLSTAVLVT